MYPSGLRGFSAKEVVIGSNPFIDSKIQLLRKDRRTRTRSMGIAGLRN
jgi:hypothetical protein